MGYSVTLERYTAGGIMRWQRHEMTRNKLGEMQKYVTQECNWVEHNSKGLGEEVEM